MPSRATPKEKGVGGRSAHVCDQLSGPSHRLHARADIMAQLGGPWAQTYDFYSAVHPMPAAPWPAPPPATLPPAPRAHLSALSSHSCRQPVTPYLFQHLLKNLFSELK